jgi:hypothetical protein
MLIEQESKLETVFSRLFSPLCFYVWGAAGGRGLPEDEEEEEVQSLIRRPYPKTLLTRDLPPDFGNPASAEADSGTAGEFPGGGSYDVEEGADQNSNPQQYAASTQTGSNQARKSYCTPEEELLMTKMGFLEDRKDYKEADAVAAVMWTAVNRFLDPRFPNTIKDIITQKYYDKKEKGIRQQYRVVGTKEWNNFDPKKLKGEELEAYKSIRETARGVCRGDIPDPIEGPILSESRGNATIRI